jgi:nucleotidyltransferase/DNA polymerase involved in DNA repair
MILGKLRPSLYLSACMVAWGVVSGATAAAHNFGGLAATRFFLGITEVRRLCSICSYVLA